MLRLAIGRTLLWFIEPAEAERDEPIRQRSMARRRAYEERRNGHVPKEMRPPLSMNPIEGLRLS
jgi:hypothetical protein